VSNWVVIEIQLPYVWPAFLIDSVHISTDLFEMVSNYDINNII